jgi:hypothetical protein
LKWLAATSTAGTSDRLAAAKPTFSTESAESSHSARYPAGRHTTFEPYGKTHKNIARQRRLGNVLFAGHQRLCRASLGCSTAIDRCLPSAAVLNALALELTDKPRKSVSINWQNRQFVRAKMLTMVKVLLVKHRYPPD